MAFFGRKSPLEALVMPAVCKYNQFRQRRREAQSKKVTERELTALHHKIVSIFSYQIKALHRNFEIHFVIKLRKNNSLIKFPGCGAPTQQHT